MKKRELMFTVVCVAALAAGVAFGTDFLSGTTYLADPKPGGWVNLASGLRFKN